MENLLPILILIFWVAFTLYNKGKKKPVTKPHAPDRTETKKPLSILEQILLGEEIKAPVPYNDDDEPEEVETVRQHVEKIKPLRKPSSPFLNFELGQYMEEGQSVTKQVFKSEIQEDLLPEHQAYIFDDEFDIKKAVIYSEILNAPYIGYK